MTATVSALKNAAQAASYHNHDDYYFKDRGPSFFSGETARRLGLHSQAVDPKLFSRLLHGHIPAEINGEVVAQVHRGGGKQRPGVDLTFSAPKSFSILALSGKRPDLVEMFNAAVDETLAEVEKSAGCRVTQNKTTQEILTNNYLVANFNHSTGRPVTLAQLESLGPEHAAEAQRLRESGAKYVIDPQLHRHAVILNMTWCEETQSYKAIDNHPLFADQKTTGAIFHAKLAAKCREAGIAMRDFGANGEFELASIDSGLIEKFSLRSALVEAELAKQGLTRGTASAKQLQAATLKTRNAKDHGIDRSELSGEWRERLAQYELESGVPLDAALRAEFAEESGVPMTAREGIESGLRHYMERSSIVKEADIVRWAIANSRGHYDISDVDAALAEMRATGEILSGELKATDDPGKETQRKAFEEAEATPEMIRYAASLAEKNGIAGPDSKSFSDVRGFLDIHAPVKMGLKDLSGEVAGRLSAARPGDIVLTTRAAQERERQMLDSVIAGKGAVTAILSESRAAELLAQRNDEMRQKAVAEAVTKGMTPAEAHAHAQKLGLNDGQLDAARLILTSTDRCNVILGVAGAGKSFTLGQAKTIIAEQAKAQGIKTHELAGENTPVGTTIRGVAPSHQAKNELREVTGEASTLQSFLTNPKEYSKLGKSDLLIVDEAGMNSTRQMAELERISAKQEFRYILVGDIRQTKAVEAGDPLSQFAEVLKKAEMNESVRHKTAHLQESARLAAAGKMAESLAPLCVQEITDAAERHQHIADRFVAIGREAEDKARITGKSAEDISAAGENARRETLVLTTTNTGRKSLNENIRKGLRLAGTGRDINTLSQKDTTAESRRYLNTYNRGDVLQFSSEYKMLGVRSGDRLTVAERQSDKLILANQSGQRFEFRPANFKTENWGLYTPDRIELAAGDRVRMRENTKDFQNGDFGRVVSLDDKTLVIRSERDASKLWTITHADRATCVDHGYAMTAHGAQGATRNYTLVDMDTSSCTLTRETAYVMNTRSRHDIEIYTSNEKALPGAISRQAYKPNALDLDRQTHRGNDHDQGAGLEA